MNSLIQCFFPFKNQNLLQKIYTVHVNLTTRKYLFLLPMDKFIQITIWKYVPRRNEISKNRSFFSTIIFHKQTEPNTLRCNETNMIPLGCVWHAHRHHRSHWSGPGDRYTGKFYSDLSGTIWPSCWGVDPYSCCLLFL